MFLGLIRQVGQGDRIIFYPLKYQLRRYDLRVENVCRADFPCVEKTFLSVQQLLKVVHGGEVVRREANLPFV